MTNLLKEFSSAHSQFIVITHNKRTVAYVLYGVTMEESGVSKSWWRYDWRSKERGETVSSAAQA